MSDRASKQKASGRKKALAVREVVPRLGGMVSVRNVEEQSNVEEAPVTTIDVQNPDRKKRNRRLTTYKRAQQAYERIQEERRQRVEQHQLEQEQREASREEYESIKEKMNKALQRRNRRGQPKLNAQMEVLLEKIEHRAKRDRAEKDRAK